MIKILVLPVKNESWILETFLKCASIWADHIIIADQNSTDGSLDIYKKFNKVIVIENKNKYHHSSVRKLLLDRAREIKGNKVIFSFDADEIPTSFFLKEEFWNLIDKLEKGTSISMSWINLWGSSNIYRDDKSVWSNSIKYFGFVDDDKMEYEIFDFVNDHSSRIPQKSMEKQCNLESPKVLHYQFTNWNRMISKQARNRIHDILQMKPTIYNFLKINYKYYFSRNENNIILKKMPKEWIEEYLNAGIDFDFTSEKLTWFDIEILSKLDKYGEDHFSLLDIWHIDWENKRKLALGEGVKNISNIEIIDPRNWFIKLYHNYFQNFLVKNIVIIRLLKLFLNKFKKQKI